jgi:iron uptake system component EfeO
MLPAFVIGLREGVEASLIVGIIAAFLAGSGRPGALRSMWLGVAGAVGLCLAVGLGLQAADQALPQAKQERVETVIALVAAGAVTYMAVWCRRRGPQMRSMIQHEAAQALAAGSTIALVGMAFFAVLREGLETAVFLVAAFQESSKPAATGTGAVLGVATACVLGVLLYRGGLRLNLARFFRITGVVLVLVAGGLLASSMHSAHEAGWLNSLQSEALDLSWAIAPGSVMQALVTGMLGIQAQPSVGEAAVWLLYVVPMLCFVLWPARRPARAALSVPAAAMLVVVLALAAAACGSGTGSGGSSGGRTVKVSLTDAGCTPAALALGAGPTTFQVTNNGAQKVSEFEIVHGQRILGEVENVADGLTRSFTLSLEPGTFTTQCPGADREHGTLRVGSAGQVETSVQAAKAVQRYRAYLVAQSALLVERVTAFKAALDAGDLAAAKRLYPNAREPYERIEPVAESFGDLDPLIDARAGDVPAKGWQGFHRIEQLLWVENTTDGAAPLAAKLLANTSRLQGLVQRVPLQPAQVANGAKSLLDEIAASKITGEEDRYSHTDLWDFAANVHGARAAVDAVAPMLSASDPQLAATVEQRFTAVQQALAPYRTGGGWVRYSRLTPADTKALSEAVDALAQPISEVAPRVAG